MIENTSKDDIIYVRVNVDLEFNIVDFQDEFVQFCNLSFRPGLKKFHEDKKAVV